MGLTGSGLVTFFAARHAVFVANSYPPSFYREHTRPLRRDIIMGTSKRETADHFSSPAEHEQNMHIGGQKQVSLLPLAKRKAELERGPRSQEKTKK